MVLLLVLSVTVWHSAAARTASHLTLARLSTRLSPNDLPTAVQAMAVSGPEDASASEELMLPTPLNGRRAEKTPLDTPLTTGKEEEALLRYYERENNESKLTSETYKFLTQGRLTGKLQAQRRSKRRAGKKTMKKKKNKKGRKRKNDEDINGQKVKRRRSKKGRQLKGANTVNSTTDLTDVHDLRNGAPAFNISQNMNCSEMKTTLQTLRASQRALKKQLVAQCRQTAADDRPRASKDRRQRKKEKENKVKKNKGKKNKTKKNKIRWKRKEEGNGGFKGDLEEELGGKMEAEGFDTSKGKITNEDMTETTEEQQDFEESNSTETQTNTCRLHLNKEIAAAKEKFKKVRSKWESECNGTSGTDNENSGDDSTQGKKKERRRKKKKNGKRKKNKNEVMDQEKDTTEDSGGQDYSNWSDVW